MKADPPQGRVYGSQLTGNGLANDIRGNNGINLINGGGDDARSRQPELSGLHEGATIPSQVKRLTRTGRGRSLEGLLQLDDLPQQIVPVGALLGLNLAEIVQHCSVRRAISAVRLDLPDHVELLRYLALPVTDMQLGEHQILQKLLQLHTTSR